MLGALVAACSGAEEPVSEPRVARTEETPSDELPEGWLLPDGWIWINEPHDGWAMAMPALPRAFTNAERTTRVILAETPRGIVRVTLMPRTSPDPIAQLRASGWLQLTTDTPWRDGGHLFSGLGADGNETDALVPRGDELLLLTAIGDPALAGPMLASFTQGSRLGATRIRHREGGFSIDAPARMDPLFDRSAQPFLRGFHGVIDGNQLSAIYVDGILPRTPEAAMRDSVAALPGTITESSVTSTEARFRCAATDGSGMVGAGRIVTRGARIYNVGVYAPSGNEPEWAQRYLDSFTLE
ncbi:Hypothetical protein I5071_6140 [Sandaracinus amylolyticus]|nr:Hypothetical protein I5071_6140 [Sandaracinus amylolyticus]